MVESMTPSNLVYTSLVTLPKSGEWKTKACSFPYFFVLLWNNSTLSRLFYYPRKMKFILHVDLPLFGWWLICQCYYFLIVFSTENIKKDTNFFFCRQLFVFWKNKKINPCHSVPLISFTIITLMLYPPHDATVHWLLFS